MEAFIISRVLHVIGVVLWIGGVAMVTTVLLPATKRMKSDSERVEFFEKVERRFAWQARFTTLLTGVTGFVMLDLTDGWQRFAQPGHWWLHGMVALWGLFTLILFVAEPLFLHRLFLRRASSNPQATFRFIQVMHWVLLLLSLVVIFGAVAGSHGYPFAGS